MKTNTFKSSICHSYDHRVGKSFGCHSYKNIGEGGVPLVWNERADGGFAPATAGVATGARFGAAPWPGRNHLLQLRDTGKRFRSYGTSGSMEWISEANYNLRWWA